MGQTIWRWLHGVYNHERDQRRYDYDYYITEIEREREREHDDTSMFSTTWKETDVDTTMIFTTESGNTHHYKHCFIILTVSK